MPILENIATPGIMFLAGSIGVFIHYSLGELLSRKQLNPSLHAKLESAKNRFAEKLLYLWLFIVIGGLWIIQDAFV